MKGWLARETHDLIAPRRQCTNGSFLVDEDASNPHGGTDGTKVLDAETFVLIDIG